jgi:hypothetical protein
MKHPYIHRHPARRWAAALLALAAAGCATPMQELKSPPCPDMPLSCKLADETTDALPRLAATYLRELQDRCQGAACGGGVKPTKTPPPPRPPRGDLDSAELEGLVLVLQRNPLLWKAALTRMAEIEASAK